jgi:hypothetical protein
MKTIALGPGSCIHKFISFNNAMALPAKTKTHGKDTTAYRPRMAVKVSRGAGESRASDRFGFPPPVEKARPDALRKPAQEKARLATFSFTPEDLRYVEKATYQVIQALETGVSKSHAVRLAMRVFASISVEELRALLHRVHSGGNHGEH